MSKEGSRVANFDPDKKKKTKRIILIVCLSVLALLLIAAACIWIYIRSGEPETPVDTVVVTPKPPVTSADPEVTDTSEQLVLHRREGVYTCLLLGTDAGNYRADTIMLGVFDTVNQSASLISIPRDTLVLYNGKNYKINAVAAMKDGVDILRQVITDTLCIPVDYYVRVRLDGFEAIVDEIGGVWFTVPQEIDYEDLSQDLFVHLDPGHQLLTGEQALGLMRVRSVYANADLGRVNIQRKFLAALVEQTITLSNIDKVTEMIKILRQYVDSDMELNTMVNFATKAIGMDLDTALNSDTIANYVSSIYLEMDDEKVLEQLNKLGIYEEEIPLEALNIHHRNK